MYCRNVLGEVVYEYFDEQKLSLLRPCWPIFKSWRIALFFCVVVANLCSWPNVKRKTKR